MLFCKSTSSDLYVQIKLSFDMLLCKLGVQQRFVSESSLEEYTYTFNVTVEVANAHKSATERRTGFEMIVITYYSAFAWDVETICGKSMRIGLPSSLIKILNSLKSPWIRPCWANLTIRSIKSLYSWAGLPTSSTCRLRYGTQMNFYFALFS